MAILKYVVEFYATHNIYINFKSSIWVNDIESVIRKGYLDNLKYYISLGISYRDMFTYNGLTNLLGNASDNEHLDITKYLVSLSELHMPAIEIYHVIKSHLRLRRHVHNNINQQEINEYLLSVKQRIKKIE